MIKNVLNDSYLKSKAKSLRLQDYRIFYQKKLQYQNKDIINEIDKNLFKIRNNSMYLKEKNNLKNSDLLNKTNYLYKNKELIKNPLIQQNKQLKISPLAKKILSNSEGKFKKMSKNANNIINIGRIYYNNKTNNQKETTDFTDNDINFSLEKNNAAQKRHNSQLISEFVGFNKYYINQLSNGLANNFNPQFHLVTLRKLEQSNKTFQKFIRNLENNIDNEIEDLTDKNYYKNKYLHLLNKHNKLEKINNNNRQSVSTLSLRDKKGNTNNLNSSNSSIKGYSGGMSSPKNLDVSKSNSDTVSTKNGFFQPKVDRLNSFYETLIENFKSDKKKYNLLREAKLKECIQANNSIKEMNKMLDENNLKKNIDRVIKDYKAMKNSMRENEINDFNSNSSFSGNKKLFNYFAPQENRVISSLSEVQAIKYKIPIDYDSKLREKVITERNKFFDKMKNIKKAYLIEVQNNIKKHELRLQEQENAIK